MTKINDYVVNQKELTFNDPPTLIWVRVKDALTLLWDENPKLHDVGSIIQSIEKHGFQTPSKYDANIGIKDGNGRIECLDLMEKDGSYSLPRGLAQNGDGSWVMPLLIGTDAKSRELAESFAISANNLSMTGGDFDASDMMRMWDDSYLGILERLAGADEVPVEIDVEWLDGLLGGSPGGKAEGQEVDVGAMVREFLVPPFTVLDARQGYWRDRKNEWLSLGIQGELGRGDELLGGGANSVYTNQADYKKIKGKRPAASYQGQAALYKIQQGLRVNGLYGRSDDSGATGSKTGTSVFDPVLCEIAYRWFCPPGGLVINPTAGESVYGIVAGALGYRYKGVELRQEQIDSNEQQALDIGVSERVEWIHGNGKDVYKLIDEDADFIMCCPPYYDLEIYSELPDDLSNLDDYDEFLVDYKIIIEESLKRLKNNRFAFFVVGDIRDKAGHYRNFVGDTVTLFQQGGAAYYNEAIFITPAGTLPVRAGGIFQASRKLGKSHQNVLVFVKGDWRAAVEACGPVEVATADDSE